MVYVFISQESKKMETPETLRKAFNQAAQTTDVSKMSDIFETLLTAFENDETQTVLDRTTGLYTPFLLEREIAYVQAITARTGRTFAFFSLYTNMATNLVAKQEKCACERAVARYITQNIRQSDIGFRLKDREFAWISEVHHKSDCDIICHNMEQALKKFVWNDTSLPLDVFIGHVMIHSNHETQKVITKAENALFEKRYAL